MQTILQTVFIFLQKTSFCVCNNHILQISQFRCFCKTALFCQCNVLVVGEVAVDCVLSRTHPAVLDHGVDWQRSQRPRPLKAADHAPKERDVATGVGLQLNLYTINQSINQSIDKLIHHSFNRSIEKQINQLIISLMHYSMNLLK